MAQHDTREMFGDTHGWVIVSREWGVYLGLYKDSAWDGTLTETPLWTHGPTPSSVSTGHAPVFATLASALEHAHNHFTPYVPGLDFKLVEGDVVLPLHPQGQLVFASKAVLLHAGARDWMTDADDASGTVNKVPM